MGARRFVIKILVIWALVIACFVLWVRFICECSAGEVISVDDVTIGSHVALRTADGWECYQLENHVGEMVWVKRPEIKLEVRL